MTRHDGAKPTQAEVYDLLLPFGKLEELVFPTDMELQIHDMPAGAIAKFLIFGESRDAVSVRCLYYSRFPLYADSHAEASGS